MLRVRHQRLLSTSAFGLLALVAELAGRSLTHRLDLGRHVEQPSYAAADYYPVLLAAVKVGLALLLARAARRLAHALGAAPATRAPRVQLGLSPRLWLVSFAVTSGLYLLQTDAERLAVGRWPLLAPWLHSSALPVFAVLAVVVAVVYRSVACWLSDYESYADETVAYVRRLFAATPPSLPCRALAVEGAPPRRLFGLAFESRPPPLAA